MGVQSTMELVLRNHDSFGKSLMFRVSGKNIESVGASELEGSQTRGVYALSTSSAEFGFFLSNGLLHFFADNQIAKFLISIFSTQQIVDQTYELEAALVTGEKLSVRYEVDSGIEGFDPTPHVELVEADFDRFLSNIKVDIAAARRLTDYYCE